MADINHRILFAGLAAFLGGCSGAYFEQSLSSTSTTSFTTAAAPTPAASTSLANVSASAVSDDSSKPAASGRVYLLRGLIGDIFSRGMDTLANEMNKRGVPAQTHGVFAWAWVADEAARAYRSDGAPIVLIGHSTGGDNAIAMARRLGEAKVPVAMLITFDPTPIADPIPANVAHAFNIYQSSNPIGGGQIRPGPGFRGHLANINLREHREIIHITMDKSATLHALVGAKILEAVAATKTPRNTAAAPRNLSPRLAAAGAPVQMPPAAVTEPPVPIKYTIPSAAPIVIWDSGMPVTVAPADTLETIAQKYGVPIWGIAQLNNLISAEGIQPGQRLVVPRNAFAPEPLDIAEPKPVVAARNKGKPARDARVKPAKLVSQAGAGGN
ncbi:MAG: LysM peptidoglycan-binding domain-containing protein [Rhizobiales bacterium]|nr:LysM peptidoglycan-binding domain-containing protein [Hyphomicrobiales bacterium]